jgi:hypothetical protein
MNIDVLNQILLSVTGDPKLVKVWWTSPNIAFSNHTPEYVFADINTRQQVFDYLLKYI